ncbi:tRNA pseudouridine synthase A [Talaromyces islandicus]|uniref:tRNA pseudouridine synthase 1 n=1 Tax=Talaromyces islandicus TaxID=28573 RepID=A0A0U1M4N8_TALIS|nr:tRNA pseudouridine synthase A [Talaromyces islandicus]
MAGRGDNKNKKRDLGRNAYRKQMIDKRARKDGEQAQKKRKLEDGEEPMPIYATHFSAEDIAEEQRRPKKKVAVLIGYSGTGYHGMQLSPKDKTIEGDLFAAFVAAGAISKANAADPKKSSLVRCARTDRGVHAAGNVVSLKLIVEDADIVQKINEHLNPQIRVWGYEVVTKSFSAYQLCDSRMYEYLIPTHCFLPPHPSTYLGKKLPELAEQHGDLENYLARQKEVADWWKEVDEREIKPILANVPEEIRTLVQAALYIEDSQETEVVNEAATKVEAETATATDENAPSAEKQRPSKRPRPAPEQREIVYETIKAIKAAYVKAKNAYRIPDVRLQRVQDALDQYLGTRNFHNYTIQKEWDDPSAKRVIKTFNASRQPIIINGTEWVSLKVHGQSFMMHQIRKMVAMIALIVRCGADPKLIQETYGSTRISIPKAPGLGLLLEHPIFDTYNKRATAEFSKQKIDFDKYEKEINEFKQREIYDRMFREEQESNSFGYFFNHIDHYPGETFLYLTSGGIPASQAKVEETSPKDEEIKEEVMAKVDSDSEAEFAGEEGG